MIGNPILYDKNVRINHIFIGLVVGFLYALMFGLCGDLNPDIIFLDGFVSFVMLYLVAVALWIVFSFSNIDSLSFFQTKIINTIYVIFGVSVYSGMECLAIYLYDENEFYVFVKLLPARLFTQICIYTAFRWYYVSEKHNYDMNNIDEDDEYIYEHKLLAEENQKVERVTVKVGQQIKVIQLDDLIYIKADDDYVSFVTNNGQYLKNVTMKECEAQMPEDKFARIHRSYIVNISKIVKIERYGQKQLLQMNNGEQIKISNNGYRVLKDKLNL